MRNLLATSYVSGVDVDAADAVSSFCESFWRLLPWGVVERAACFALNFFFDEAGGRQRRAARRSILVKLGSAGSS